MTGLWKDYYLQKAGRGVYTIRASEQMLHGKSWGKHFSQSWGNIDQLNFHVTTINVIPNVIEQ